MFAGSGVPVVYDASAEHVGVQALPYFHRCQSGPATVDRFDVRREKRQHLGEGPQVEALIRLDHERRSGRDGDPPH